MGKVKRGKGKATKTPRKLTAAEQHSAISRRVDISTLEQWQKRIGVEWVDEGEDARRKSVSFAMLAIRDRTVDAGGIVTEEAAVNEHEHPILDPLFKAGVFHDSRDEERARKRLEAGLELLRLADRGHITHRCTASWSGAAGTGGGGVINEADIENESARAEMKFYNAKDAVGPDLWPKIRSICLDGEVLHGTKPSQTKVALDVLAECLLNFDVPAGFVRPKPFVRDRTMPPWLKKKLNI